MSRSRVLATLRDQKSIKSKIYKDEGRKVRKQNKDKENVDLFIVTCATYIL